MMVKFDLLYSKFNRSEIKRQDNLGVQGLWDRARNDRKMQMNQQQKRIQSFFFFFLLETEETKLPLMSEVVVLFYSCPFCHQVRKWKQVAKKCLLLLLIFLVSAGI